MTARRIVLAAAVFTATPAVLITPWAVGEVSTFGARLSVPTSAHTGQSFRAVGSNVRAGHTYRITFDQLAADKRPGIECARSIDRTYVVKTSGQRLIFKGRIPATLACSRSSGGRLAATVKVTPGLYRWVLAQKTSRAGYDQQASIVVKKVQVSAP